MPCVTPGSAGPAPLTWVNEAGITLVVLVPAAGDGVTHDLLLPRAHALDLIVLTALPTHDVPLGSGARFVNDRVLWNGNQQVRTGAGRERRPG